MEDKEFKKKTQMVLANLRVNKSFNTVWFGDCASVKKLAPVTEKISSLEIR